MSRFSTARQPLAIFCFANFYRLGWLLLTGLGVRYQPEKRSPLPSKGSDSNAMSIPGLPIVLFETPQLRHGTSR